MIENHLKKRGIVDRRVLDIMSHLKREIFVSAQLRDNAYDDSPLPIGNDQTISQPYITAFMTQELQIQAENRVLEIGTGSGYQTALLSRLAKMVYTVERITELAHNARQIFRFLGMENIESTIGDGSLGWAEYAPYQRIIVTAAARMIPKQLIEQLADNGKMIIPVGSPSGVQKLILVEKQASVIFQKELCHVRFVPLIIEQ